MQSGCPYKTSAQNHEKLTPPLSSKCPHLLNLPCPCGHPKNFEKPEVFCTKKNADVRIWRTPWLRTSFMDSPN